MPGKYTLDAVAADEAALFYDSRIPGRDLETGCIGHMRFDFGRDGKGFWSSWENHCAILKTQAFKDEFDEVVNHLRDNGIFKNRDTMQAHCRNNPQTKLSDGREYNHGFRIKTDSHVYYLRCTTINNDYSYIYAYERSRLEKCFPSLADTAMTDELRSKLEKAAAFIIEKSANETTSGNYIICADDIPADVLSPELFEAHISEIAEMMEEYEAVADVGFTANGEIDVIIYSDYCPNYEPLPEEQGEFSSDRKILDPLKSRRVPEPDKPIPAIPAEKPKPIQKVYKKDIHHARANGEVKLFEESCIINRHCALAIDSAITQSQAAQVEHDFSDSASELISEYGAERVKWVLANTVNHNYDGAVYSAESVEWANTMKANHPGGVFYYLHADAKLVDGFITSAKKHFLNVERSRKNAPATLTERIAKNKEKAAAQGKSAPHKPKKREELT